MSQDLIELGKRNAARKAVEENIKTSMVLGIGSGSTVVYAVERVAELKKEKKFDLKCISTSYQAKQLILQHKLELVTLEQYPEIDLDIDGADDIDKELNLIKGGGACLVQEKIVASNSKKLVIVADFRKNSKKLGESYKAGVPIEVIPMAYVPIIKKLEKLGSKPVLRMGKAKMGPLVTDNGNFLIDADFGIIDNPGILDRKIKEIPGVVDTGFFVGMASMAYIGQKDGSVLVLKR